MKNILLALASFLVVSVLLLQVALAQSEGDDGFTVRKGGVLTSDDPNEPIKGEGRNKTEGNAFVPGGDDCTDCAPHVKNVGMRKDTKYVPRGADTDADGNPTNPRGRR